MNVKKIILFFIPHFLLSCGYDTKNWPKIVLPFESEQLDNVVISYRKQSSANELEEINDTITITNKEDLNRIYLSCINFPYKKEQTNIDKSKYHEKVTVTFFYILNNFVEEYLITYYGYGVSNGYIIINGNIHFVPGNFTKVFYL